jgi:hypothetical protein
MNKGDEFTTPSKQDKELQNVLREHIIELADKQIWNQEKIPNSEVIADFLKKVYKLYDI